jgi:hypothetical protein
MLFIFLPDIFFALSSNLGGRCVKLFSAVTLHRPFKIFFIYRHYGQVDLKENFSINNGRLTKYKTCNNGIGQ